MKLSKGKKVNLIVMLILIAVMSFSAVVSASSKDTTKTTALPEQESKATINVNGKGIITTAPDIVYISFGVETRKTDSAAAQQENKEIMTEMMAVLRGLGISETDIKTINYTVYPNYVWNDITRKNTIDGYTVSNIIDVKITNIDNIGKVLDAVSKKNANITRSLRYDCSKRQELYEEALSQAVTNAKRKAEVMSKAFGGKALYLITINEVGDYSYNNYTPNYSTGVYRAETTKDSAVPVSVGVIEIQANVNITFGY